MDVEAQAKEMAERVGWQYSKSPHFRCAGVDDIALAMIAFSDEQNKKLRTEVERLRSIIKERK